MISICSASGQLYIFYTISKFGPVTFVIIMTIRQVIAESLLKSTDEETENDIYIIRRVSVTGSSDIAVMLDLSSPNYHYRRIRHIAGVRLGILTDLL